MPAGTGQALYDLSVQSQIDDAFALAFFQHESAFGTTGMARFWARQLADFLAAVPKRAM